MTRLPHLASALLLGWAIVALAPSARAQESNGTPTAKGFFAQGDTLARAGKPTDAIAAFRKAIDADPDFVDAHQRFIESTQRAEMPGTRTPLVPRLFELYTRWAREHPKAGGVPVGARILDGGS